MFVNEDKNGGIGGVAWLRVLPLLLGLSFIGLGVFAAYWYMTNRPKAQRRSVAGLTPIVEFQELERRDIRVLIPAMGTVIAARELTLRSRVAGEVIYLHDDFESGGLIDEGEVLLRLDRRDYELALVQRESELEKARCDLDTELGQQRLARQQYERFDREKPILPEDEALILRKPQERIRRAEIAIAEAAVELTHLDLERTEIKSPFAAIIISTGLELGDQVAVHSELAELVATDSYWVRCSLPARDLIWLDLPDSHGVGGSRVRVSAVGGEREGRVIRLLGDIEESGRMARVLVEVKDPLGSGGAESSGSVPLLLGEFVRLEIIGKELADVYAVPRSAYRDGHELWLLDGDSRLRIFPVEPIWGDREYIYLDEKIPDACRLITSSLGFPVEGMSLRLIGETSASDAVAEADRE